MKHPEVGFHSHARARLVVYPPDPPNAIARRVIGALRAERLADAIRYARELPCDTSVEQAWSGYLESRIHLENGDYAAARTAALKSASAALTLAFDDRNDSTRLRLASAALETQGTALRRQDQYGEATRIHRAAFELRRSDGISEEQVDSALSLAACSEWLGDAVGAETWYQAAIGMNLGEADSALLKAWAMIRFSTWLTMKCRHSEAVALADGAQQLLHQFMPGELATTSAGLSAVDALINHAEALHVEAPEDALTLIHKASKLLETMNDELSAFGASAEADLVWCKEKLEFLRRLRQSLEETTTAEKHA